MTSRRACVLALGLGILVLGFEISALHAQRGEQYLRIGRLEEWVALAERHVPGRDDEATASVASWSSSDLQHIFVALPGLASLIRDPDARFFYPPPPPGHEGRQVTAVIYHPADAEAFRRVAYRAAARGDFNRVVKRGALLHTDVAMLGRSMAGGTTPAARDSTTLYFNDGRQLALETDLDHWRLARQLLDFVLREPRRAFHPDPAGDDDVRRWYQATAAVMLARQAINLSHFARALELFPRDADILFLAGSLHEMLAMARVQDVLRSTRLPGGVTFDVASARDELQRADSLFRASLAAAPQHAEARVRRGRILRLLGRTRDAIALLRPAIANASDPLLRYYAELFLAEAAESEGDFDVARPGYERAAALYPRAPSPRLALSQLALRAGDQATAAAAMRAALALGEDAAEDPWWAYHRSAGRDAEARLDRMYAGFAESAP